MEHGTLHCRTGQRLRLISAPNRAQSRSRIWQSFRALEGSARKGLEATPRPSHRAWLENRLRPHPLQVLSRQTDPLIKLLSPYVHMPRYAGLAAFLGSSQANGNALLRHRCSACWAAARHDGLIPVSSLASCVPCTWHAPSLQASRRPVELDSRLRYWGFEIDSRASPCAALSRPRPPAAFCAAWMAILPVG